MNRNESTGDAAVEHGDHGAAPPGISGRLRIDGVGQHRLAPTEPRLVSVSLHTVGRVVPDPEEEP